MSRPFVDHRGVTELPGGLEELFRDIPLPVLEVWGRFGYFVGLALAILAFGGFTFRLGSRWGLGRERQAWDAKAVLAIPITFVLIVATGYLGSFVVLVPGAQTLESLKDLVVLVCLLLFGYPALVTVPFAYGLSDLIEGVPPDFLVDWLPGYFINPACFWLAYQLFGKCPDFRRPVVWVRYVLFIVAFMSIEPALWGYICADEFTAEISYRAITPAIVLTTSITWLIAPPVLLVALPLARKFGLFWAEIPDHVLERPLGSKQWVWRAARDGEPSSTDDTGLGVPLRMFVLMPFIGFVLLMVGLTAVVALWSAEREALKLASRLQAEVGQYIQLRLDDHLSQPAAGAQSGELDRLLAGLPIARDGRAFILTGSGELVASSAPAGDPIVAGARSSLARAPGGLADVDGGTVLNFAHVTAHPLASETWLVHADAYRRGGGSDDWIVTTAMPERSYLSGVQTGHRGSAMVFAVALLLALAIAAFLASAVARPLLRLASAAEDLAGGALTRRAPVSRLEELGTLARSFNGMASQLEDSFAALATSEERVKLAVKAAKVGVWDWDVVRDELRWDDSMSRLYGVERAEEVGAYEMWTRRLAPEDVERAKEDVAAALRGEREFSSEFRVRWPDGSLRVIRGVAQTFRAPDGSPVRMVGVNWDVTEALHAEQELRRHRDHLEELVAERTAALSVAVGRAQAAGRAKGTFLASMSHEIRTPLNSILGYAQLLQQDAGLDEAQRRKLEVIHASGEHLLALINDILEMSRLEAGRTAIVSVPFDLRALLGEVNVMSASLVDASQVELFLELDGALPEAVEGDPGKVRQVLINLVGNATKFTKRGAIRVAATSQPLGPGRQRVTITVSDTGAGMAAADLPRIFEAFDQLETGARLGGSGLGLAISRSFARLMNGDITVTSEPGKGSTFTFTFEVGATTSAVPAFADARTAPAVAANAAELSVVLGDLPPDLVARIRAAASEARAGRLDELAGEVARHSAVAADQIHLLAQRFDYESLLDALPPVADGPR